MASCRGEVKGAAFAEAGLTGDCPASTILAAMAAEPRLMERPIVIRGERAVLGRPTPA